MNQRINRKTWKEGQLLSGCGFIQRIAPPSLSRDRRIKMKQKTKQSNDWAELLMLFQIKPRGFGYVFAYEVMKIFTGLENWRARAHFSVVSWSLRSVFVRRFEIFAQLIFIISNITFSTIWTVFRYQEAKSLRWIFFEEVLLAMIFVMLGLLMYNNRRTMFLL